MKKQLIFLAGLVFTLSSCAPQTGFKSQSQEGGTQAPPTTTPSTNPSEPLDQTWQNISDEMTSSVSGGIYDSKTLIEIDVARQAVVFVLPFSQFLFPLLSAAVSTKYPDIVVEEAQRVSGELAWAVVIPIKYFSKQSQVDQIEKLPNGVGNLPGFPKGEAKGIQIQFPQKTSHTLYIYLTTGAAAVFVQFAKPQIPFGLKYPIVNKAQTRVNGYLQIYPNVGQVGGVYLSAQFTKQTLIKLNQILKF